MNLVSLKAGLARVKRPEQVEETWLRFVDSLGNTLTVPIETIIEEIPLSEAEGQSRRIILVGAGISK